MQIKDHRVGEIPFKRAAWIGGKITPSIVILHDTAGRLEKGNSAKYLASENRPKVSVHFVIERDGTITQLVPTNRRANHVGRSSYHERESCNNFAVGIELVNPGKMTWSGPRALAWWGERFDIEAFGIESCTTDAHGSGLWMPYPEAQMAALIELLDCLFGGIPTLTDITTHWYVSPGRKVDTNPLFPLEHVRALILGRDDPATDEAYDNSDPADGTEMVTVASGESGLNLRRWPSFNPNVLTSIPNGTRLAVLRTGNIRGRRWLCVIYDGQEGWIVARYTKTTDTPLEE